MKNPNKIKKIVKEIIFFTGTILISVVAAVLISVGASALFEISDFTSGMIAGIVYIEVVYLIKRIRNKKKVNETKF